MKSIIYICVSIISSFAIAGDGNVPILNTSELQDWCRYKSADHFIAQDITPYNWSASWWTKINVLHVKGEWKVNNKKQVVKCRVLSGAERKYAIIEMPSQNLTALSYENERPINNSNELVRWCKNTSAMYYIERNQTPYYWSFSQWGKGNFLNVKGNWKVNNSNQVINCKIQIGVAEKYASMKISN
jgi:hypothetical protein